MPASLHLSEEEMRERVNARWRNYYHNSEEYRNRKREAAQKYAKTANGKLKSKEKYQAVRADPEKLKKVKAAALRYMRKRLADPEKHAEQNKRVREYFKTEKGKEARLRAERKRSETMSIQRKLSIYLRKRIWKVLKDQTAIKHGNLYDLIGITIDGLRKHLELTFADGMSWDNYGQWHVDHKKPCAAFDLTDFEQQRICFHYTNLQALWASDNIKKGAEYKRPRVRLED